LTTGDITAKFMEHGCSEQMLEAVAKEQFDAPVTMRLAVFLALFEYHNALPKSSISWEVTPPLNLFMESKMRAERAVNKMYEVNRFLLLRVWQKYAAIKDDELENFLEEEDRLAFVDMQNRAE